MVDKRNSINGKYNIGIILFSIIKVQKNPMIPKQLIKAEKAFTYRKQQMIAIMLITPKPTRKDSVITPKAAIKAICAPKTKALSRPKLRKFTLEKNSQPAKPMIAFTNKTHS